MHKIGLVRCPPESSEGYDARVNQIRNNWLSAAGCLMSRRSCETWEIGDRRSSSMI
jgi:hypothetical protein